MTKELEGILIEILEEKGPEWRSLIPQKIGYEILKKHFSDGKEYDTFFADVQSNPEKLKEFDTAIRFYYFRCKRPSVSKVLDPNFKLIVMFSIIENLMSEEDFMPLDQWLQSKMKKDRLKITTQKELESVLEDYYKVHGSKRKVKSFFEKYYTKKDLKSLMNSLERWRKGEKRWEKINDINGLLEFVEGIRNLFIHRAIAQIPSADKGNPNPLIDEINNTLYCIDRSIMHIEGLLDGFEKGIIKYFSVANKLK